MDTIFATPVDTVTVEDQVDTLKVTLTMPQVADQQCWDVMTTVAESGFGDWFHFRKIQRNEKLDIIAMRVVSDEQEPVKKDMDTKQIRMGINRILCREVIVNDAIFSQVLSLLNQDAADCDAEAADAILQAAMFGEIVYA